MTARHLIALMLLAVPAAVSAQPDGEMPLGFSNTRRIESFANGDIRHSPASDIYFFVVGATDKSGRFWLQCERRGPFTVAIALAGAGDKPQRSQLVTLRADGGPPRTLDLVVFDNFVAIASRHEGKPTENASIFMQMLEGAQRTFTVSYGGQSHEFDVGGLAAPRKRFLELCRRVAP